MVHTSHLVALGTLETHFVVRTRLTSLQTVRLGLGLVDAKYKVGGSIGRHKTHLIAKEFTQREGYDLSDIYSSVTRLITSIRVVFAITLLHNLAIHQINIKIIFLNGELN